MQIPPEVERIAVHAESDIATIVADEQAAAPVVESKIAHLWKAFHVEMITVAIVIVLSILLTFIK